MGPPGVQGATNSLHRYRPHARPVPRKSRCRMMGPPREPPVHLVTLALSAGRGLLGLRRHSSRGLHHPCAACREAPALRQPKVGTAWGVGGQEGRGGVQGLLVHVPQAQAPARGLPGRRERVLGSSFKARPRRERGTERGGWRAGGLVRLPVAGGRGPGRVPVWEAHKEKWSLEFSL